MWRRMHAVAKAAKAVGAKVALQQGLDEEEADAEDADEDLERRRLWGANKRAYHGADEVTGWCDAQHTQPVEMQRCTVAEELMLHAMTALARA